MDRTMFIKGAGYLWYLLNSWLIVLFELHQCDMSESKRKETRSWKISAEAYNIASTSDYKSRLQKNYAISTYTFIQTT